MRVGGGRCRAGDKAATAATQPSERAGSGHPEQMGCSRLHTDGVSGHSSSSSVLCRKQTHQHSTQAQLTSKLSSCEVWITSKKEKMCPQDHPTPAMISSPAANRWKGYWWTHRWSWHQPFNSSYSLLQLLNTYFGKEVIDLEAKHRLTQQKSLQTIFPWKGNGKYLSYSKQSVKVSCATC